MLTQPEFLSFSIQPVATMVPILTKLIESLSFSERERTLPLNVSLFPNEAIYTYGNATN